MFMAELSSDFLQKLDVFHAAEVPSSALGLLRTVKMAPKFGFQRTFGSTFFIPERLHDVHPNLAPNFAGPGFEWAPSHSTLKQITLSIQQLRTAYVQRFVATQAMSRRRCGSAIQRAGT